MVLDKASPRLGAGFLFVMELVTEDLLYRRGVLDNCPTGGIPKWIAIVGDTWATLLTGFVWRDREHFLFVSDRTLLVDDELWIKYRDEWLGLVEVRVRVVSVVARSGGFEIQATGVAAEVVKVLAAA